MAAAAQSPISGHRSGRKPLQPKNSSPIPFDKPKPNLSNLDPKNKENVHPDYSSTPTHLKKEMESFDASLAEELTAIREKLQRLRIDKEKTERMLKERAVELDLRMKEFADRWVLQKQLEIEVDRLFRLKEIKLSCTIVSPIRSLREKEQAKKVPLLQQKDEDEDHLKIENQDEIEVDQNRESPVQTENFRPLEQTLPTILT